MTELTEAYSTAILQAGGLPILIPSVFSGPARDALFHRLDGILLSGGGDIQPRLYSSQYAGRLVEVDVARDDLELDLTRRAAETGKPLLGICRGCQVLNVALGGTLYPDLPTDPAGPITHDLPGNERRVFAHEVAVRANTHLSAILGTPALQVNSHHHQGLKAIAPKLTVSGSAPDGLVEAVEIAGHPFALAVQWHPEWLTDQGTTQELFRSFVDAASRS